MMADAAVSVPNPRQDIDLFFVILQRFRHIRKLDSQHRFLQKALFMTTSSRVFFKDPAFFYVICSAEKPMG